MNHIKSILVLAILSLTNICNAQKVGHINSQELLALMPETKKIKNELEKLGKTYEEELKTLATELQTKLQKYNTEAPTKGDAINQSRAKEIKDLQLRIEEYRKNAATDVQKKQVELMQPIQKRLKKALDKVRKSKKLDYIFDLAGGSIVSFSTSNDVSGAVKKALKLKK